MPPRIPFVQCLRTQNVPSATRSFSASTSTNASTVAQRRKYRDPYAIAQAKARKAANLSRREVLLKERAAALGDPVRGVTTPYLESFDTGTPPPTQTPADSREEHLNFLVSASDLTTSLQQSTYLTKPSSDLSALQLSQQELSDRTIESTEESLAAEHRKESSTAAEALRRIASLSLGSSKDLLRVNKQRCIDDFGRHNTDTTLPPKPASAVPVPEDALPKTPRVGPDTGSSEVQIAILTAKIRTLAGFLETRGTMDKVNKRNLRLLVHRRQKLLRYLERKERGGPRFKNVIELLGLTEGTWRGEISL